MHCSIWLWFEQVRPQGSLGPQLEVTAFSPWWQKVGRVNKTPAMQIHEEPLTSRSNADTCRTIDARIGRPAAKGAASPLLLVSHQCQSPLRLLRQHSCSSLIAFQIECKCSSQSCIILSSCSTPCFYILVEFYSLPSGMDRNSRLAISVHFGRDD